ncbi:hypothetical protein SAMN04488563_1279 [Jiangella alkaliphila]|uniref:Uncharacterized protein n=1 Tax=Jiangella alkaliphila TaxID=419479 RepID=A0A1H2HWQ6_9ACTN|nr:hypothetical protein SAMN04488563_1279 [Jiangella alkaliphila]
MGRAKRVVIAVVASFALMFTVSTPAVAAFAPTADPGMFCC